MTSYAAEFAVNSVLIFEEKNRIDRNPRTFDATFIKGSSINHVDGILDIFDPPSPPCGPTWFFGQPPLENHVEFWRTLCFKSWKVSKKIAQVCH